MSTRFLLKGLLLLPVAAVVAAVPVQAQRLYSAEQLAAAINKAVFAEALRWKGKLKGNEAAAIEQIEQQRAQIARLRQLAQSQRNAQQGLSAQIAALERDNENRIARLLDGISQRDDEISRLLAAFRRNITQLAETEEGRQALALYNEGRVVESDALIAKLDEQELAAQRLGLRLNEAARFRRRAELMLPKIGQGGATTEMVIRLLVQATERDPDVSRDWTNLSKLYATQRQMAKAEAALKRARALVSNPVEEMNATFAASNLAEVKGDSAAFFELMKGALSQAASLPDQFPELEIRFPQEFRIVRKLRDAVGCTDGTVFKECFVANLAEAEVLMRAYNDNPPPNRRFEPLMESYVAATVAAYYANEGDDRATRHFQAIVARVPILVPAWDQDIPSLDLLFMVHQQLGAAHFRARRLDAALSSLSDALRMKRRIVTLDASSVQAKLDLTRSLLALGLLGMMRDEKVTALAQLNEARSILQELMRVTDHIEARRISWYAMVILALFDSGETISGEVVADMEAAEVRGLLNARDKALLADLKLRLSSAGKNGNLLTPQEQALVNEARKAKDAPDDGD